MDETLKEKLLKHLTSLDSAVDGTGGFASTEIPETIRQWLLWQVVYNAGMAAVFLTLAVTAAVLVVEFFRRSCRKERELEELRAAISGNMGRVPGEDATDYYLREQRLRDELSTIGNPASNDTVVGCRMGVMVLLVACAASSYATFTYSVSAFKAYLVPRAVLAEKLVEMGVYFRR